MRVFMLLVALVAGGSVWYLKVYKKNWDSTPSVFSTPKGYAAPVALDQGTIENKLKQIEAVTLADAEVSAPPPAVAAAPAIALSRGSSKAAKLRKVLPTKRLIARRKHRGKHRRRH